MSLFRKKNRVKEYSDNKLSWLLAGLGNPGSKYATTWHNCGYLAIDRLADRLGVHLRKSRFQAVYEQVNYAGCRLILLKPETYMNNSGESVRAAMDFFKIPARRVVIFYDDIDLPLEASRLRERGGAGTHNGMRSLLKHMGTGDFPRFRIGIGPLPPHLDIVDYVLANIGKEQAARLLPVLDRCGEAALALVSDGTYDRAMRMANVNPQRGARRETQRVMRQGERVVSSAEPSEHSDGVDAGSMDKGRGE